MELLIGLLMNVLGADLYDRCPRLARWIVRKAVARLPEGKRDEHRETWNAHLLLDCDTKLDQLRYAIGCWCAVGGIAGAAPRPKRYLRLDLTIVASGLMTVAGTGEAVNNLFHGMPWWGLLFYATQVVPSVFVVVLGLRMRREKGNVVEM